MKSNYKTPNQPEVSAARNGASIARKLRVSFPAPVVIPNGNGEYLVRPGAPVIEDTLQEDEIGTTQAAKELKLSPRRVLDMCDSGIFKEGLEWRRPGGPRGKYFIKRSAVERQKKFTGEREEAK